MTVPERGGTIAHQSVEQLGGRSSILARQRADHARLDRLMDRARATRAAGGREHAVALRAVARLVFTHAFAEESVLFPAARRGSRSCLRGSFGYWAGGGSSCGGSRRPVRIRWCRVARPARRSRRCR